MRWVQGRFVVSLGKVFKVGLRRVSRVCGNGKGVQRVAGGGRCWRYTTIIDLDSIQFVSVIGPGVREVRKGRSLVDSGMVEAID